MCAHLRTKVFPYSLWIPLRLVCHCFFVFVCMSPHRQCAYTFILFRSDILTRPSRLSCYYFFFFLILRSCISFINTRLSPLAPRAVYLTYAHAYIIRVCCIYNMYIYKTTGTRSSRVLSRSNVLVVNL